MISISFAIFIFISYICLALTTSAILNLDIGNPLSNTELLIYKNQIVHIMATFALMYSLTKNILISCLTIAMYIIFKYIPNKKMIRCSNSNYKECKKFKRDKIVKLI